MRRKSRQRLLFRLKVIAICGAAAFMTIGVMDCFSKADDESETRIAAVSKVPAVIVKESGEQKNEINQSQGFIQSMDWGAEDAYLLAKIAMAEAEGEGVEGKALVMLVVLNRVWSDEFPDSIETVIFQKGQFSPVSNGRYDSVEPDEECFEALEWIQEKKWDESQGALYFESKSNSKWHRDNLQFLFQYGNHYFYK